MDWLFWLGVAGFILMLLFTVAIHEAGHMAAAKALKLDVPEFSVGFGPKLWKKQGKKTEYSLRAIPLGGFVQIEDRRYPEKSYERGSLARVRPWKRQIVFVAGPAVNIIFGMALLLGTLMFTPYTSPSNQVGELYPCTADVGCAAKQAGFQVGDYIVEIDGIPVTDFETLGVAKDAKPVLESVIVERAGERVELTNVKLTESEMGTYMLGIKATSSSYRTLPEAWTFVESSLWMNLEALSLLPAKVPSVAESVVTGEKKPEDPASVIVASKTYGDLAADTEIKVADKVSNFLYWSALFNLGIGLINLLPILPLDGGRMLIAFIDSIRIRWASLRKVKYSPVTKTAFTTASIVSAVMVFGFMGLIMLSDIRALFAGTL